MKLIEYLKTLTDEELEIIRRELFIWVEIYGFTNAKIVRDIMKEYFDPGTTSDKLKPYIEEEIDRRNGLIQQSIQKIDNKPNHPMPKDYDEFKVDPKLVEEYARKAADMLGMSFEEFINLNHKPVGAINHPKHIVYNGVLYEKIDDAVVTIAKGE